MLSEIGIDNNTTTIVLVPSDLTNGEKFYGMGSKENINVSRARGLGT